MIYMGEKTTEYIFGELASVRAFNNDVTKYAINTKRALIAQTKFNKAILALAALGVAYMYFNEKKNIRLTKEVEELKRMKGE